ncbi:MAG: exodeoxyribonuclease VII small subunit [Caldilineae bacterium]|nr:MAG: exodeoxyribonuclease VII small subunit [Caldilineae bacterium]
MDLSDLTDLTFEQALAELRQIVTLLESGNGELDEHLARYERGVLLARYCTNLLDRAELRIRELTPEGEEIDFTGPLDSRS